MQQKATILHFICLLLISFTHSCKEQSISENSSSQKIESIVRNRTDTLQYIENIPIVYIDGNGYEAGYKHGSLLKSEIEDVVNIMYNVVFDTASLNGRLEYSYTLIHALLLEQQIPQIYRDEMRGVADGADVEYNEILIFNTYDDLLHLSMCSSISAIENAKHPFTFHARNLDYPIEVLAGKNVILHYLDQEFISVGFPGYIGALTATNYHGISLSSHTAAIANNESGVPSGILYRMIIEHARQLDDVELILNSNQRTIGNNLLVSSLLEKKIAIFQITPKQVHLIESNLHLVATNHFISDSMIVLSPPSQNSAKRFRFLDFLYKKSQKLPIDIILSGMSFYDGNLFDWSSVSNKGTVQSVVFIPESHTLYIAKGSETPVTSEGYAVYDYGDFVQNKNRLLLKN
jgi:predicted choloylglycine hydrolase